MLARVAENIYWMARYLERAEDMARLINVNASLALDLPRGLAPIWSQLIAISGAQGLYPETDYDEAPVLKFLVCDEGSPVSMLSCIACARENARTIRDVIPREVWESINALYLYAREHQQLALNKRGRFRFLNDVIRHGQTTSGVLSGTMSHDAGYTFLRIGRYLERADMTSRIVDIRSANLLPEVATARATYDNLQWMSVLSSLSGYQMYRREMQIRVQRAAVLKFLLQSREFPRALRFCIDAVRRAVVSMPNAGGALDIIEDIARRLDEAQPAVLKQTELQLFIDQLQIGFARIHDELQAAYFSGGAANAA